MPRHYRHTTAEEIMQDHRDDPDRITSGFTEDELEGHYLSPIKIGLWTPSTRYQPGGMVGVFDLSEQKWNELTETRSAVLPRQSRNRVYHLPFPEFDGAPAGMQCHPGLPAYYAQHTRWKDHFRGYVWTDRSPDRFPASNWEELGSAYTPQPDFAESTSPESVDAPDGQAGLDEFAGEIEPCAYSEIRSCDCCRCENGHSGIRARKDKEPTYVCNSPNCDWSGESPDISPTRRD